ncbi:expressed unknown protein [Seminavis robusta]|uniref:Uncharacterized protein n=1 Tax=Seminavis robusta TaxID=568900 RepID=A0A9N8E3I1_9STRA|nr:expressed unknown protein [Seminavis robusta]|eukprot:Sro488_g153040.1 n/a (352) ;mRNA; f:20344-21399
MRVDKRFSSARIHSLLLLLGFFLPRWGLSVDAFLMIKAPYPSIASCLSLSSSLEDNDDSSNSFFESLLSRFQGDFDNYHQVVQDRSQGLLPREGGGHEQIHCLLVPVPPVVIPQTGTTVAGRLAAFYFDGIPQRIFRFRYYELKCVDDESSSSMVNMTLYCLHPTLEGQLRGISDPMEWPQAMSEFASSQPDEPVVTLLPNCDVQWSRDLDPVQHDYAQRRNDELQQQSTSDTGIHAVMVHGQAIVDSTMMPGTKIKVLDQLSLWDDQFWIHDRGLDPETGDFIYGNQRGVPYQLERVTQLKQTTSGWQRHVTNQELQWTLGPTWRTAEEYQAKLDAVGGGVSSQLNRRSK